MANERIVVTTDTRELEGMSPQAAEAILANTNPKFRMFIDEHPQAVTGDGYHDQLIVKMKTATGEEVAVKLTDGAGSGKGKSLLQLDTSKMLMDVGNSTAYAVRQQDGSWEVDGQGSADLVYSMAVSAERKARKVGFLPRQVERKIARSTRLALVRDGQITLSDGMAIRRANGQG